MDFWQAVRSGFANYVTFSGRAVRSEYWYWVLFVSIVALAATLLDLAIVHHRHGPFEGLWTLVTFLPGLAIAVRRLHDIDRSGWWMLLPVSVVGIFVVTLLIYAVTGAFVFIIPILAVIGLIVILFYWFCQPGTPGPNRFGPDPFKSSPHPAA